jgi:glycosyltransferase involved in cell wall biosynthesis
MLTPAKMIPTEPGLVSVMMPAYNAEPYIGQAIESLLAQSYSHWELIVVNDGSTDETPRIARAFTDPRIRVVDQPNGGEASARNTALRHSRGEFVAFLDADDRYFPEHLELTAGFLLQNADCDAVYSDGYHCDGAGVRLQTLSSRRLPPADGNIFDQMVRAACMLGPPLCVVLRRNLVLQMDLWFDTSFTIMDWDFFTRFAEVARFHYVDHRTCLYRIHETNISSSVGSERRLANLAQSRRKAMQLKSFDRCSVGTRAAAFYDLLVFLLLGKPQEQAEIIGGAGFAKLPAKEQARILRLMASKAILHAEECPLVAEWLRRARALNRSDKTAFLLSVLWELSPALCRQVLRVRTRSEGDPRLLHPFGDIARNSTNRSTGADTSPGGRRTSRAAGDRQLIGAGK